MLHSIQDYLRKINSRLTWTDMVSILVTVLFLLCFTGFLYVKKHADDVPVSYLAAEGGEVKGATSDSRPFASINGKTYTFSWCNGASNISAKNKIYFASESEAQTSGRSLSKLCTK